MTSSCLFILACATLCLAAPPHLSAQLPRSIRVPIVFGSPLPDDGLYMIDVRLYGQPIGGQPLWKETIATQIRDGRAEVMLGTASDLPDTLLRSGAVFIGISLEAENEREPRTPLLPVATALSSAYAEVAARLDPRATGLVTSINELAGPVSMVGLNGITISRQGTTLSISSSSVPLEQGTIRGDGSSSVYRVRPLTKIHSGSRVTFSVRSPTTMLVGQMSMNEQANELVFTISACMLPDEQIDWSISP